MGLWDDIWAPASIWGSTKDQLISHLETTSSYLGYIEHAVGDPDAIAKYRNRIDKTVTVLNLPGTVARDLASAIKIRNAVAQLSKIPDIRADPERAAIAFGRLFAGIGELAQYLPPPVNGYIGIFRAAENFFVNFRANVGHMDGRMRKQGVLRELDME